MIKLLKEFSELFFDGVNEYISAKGIDMLTFFGKQMDRGYFMPIDFSIIEFLAGQIDDPFINQLEEYPVVSILSDESELSTVKLAIEYILEVTGFEGKCEIDNDLSPRENLAKFSNEIIEKGLRVVYFDLGELFPFGIVKNSNVDRIVDIYNNLTGETGYKIKVM